MLGKVMKYEFMALGRVLWPLYGGFVALAVVNRVLFALPSELAGLFIVFGGGLAVLALIGIIGITFVLIILRFWKNLMSTEGYLMMTLPASVDSIILGKLFVTAIASIACSVILIASGFLMISFEGVFELFFGSIAKAVGEAFADNPGRVILIALEGLLYLALSTTTFILLIYACLSLSMLVQKRRGLFAFGAFLVISTIVQIISIFVFSFGTVADSYIGISDFANAMSGYGLFQAVAVTAIVYQTCLSAAYYFITRFMLKNKLNLL